VSCLLERPLNLEIEKAYNAIKAVFTKKDCKIISEQLPNKILFKQGSLWGISPISAKKKIQVNLESFNSTTKVTCTSRLGSDWKNITLVGCVLAAVLVGLCLWMAFDLNTFVSTNKNSVWSWLITVNGNVDSRVAEAFVNLTKTLAAFLSAIIFVEIVITIYVHNKIDRFAEQTLNSISG
jgi:hypothetical protein